MQITRIEEPIVVDLHTGMVGPDGQEMLALVRGPTLLLPQPTVLYILEQALQQGCDRACLQAILDVPVRPRSATTPQDVEERGR